MRHRDRVFGRARGCHGEKVLFQDINLSISKGDKIALVAKNGSGKTTLLGLCAGLDQSDSGTVTLCGQELSALNEDERALLRNKEVGFIFQDFQLLSTLTALENVSVPLELQGVKHARKSALSLLEKVGLADRQHHYPSQLSGGEQQRVAMARAFINKPSILFADEPTGNLDEETGEKVVELLFELNKQAGTTLVIVTHDLDLAKRTRHILKLKGGKIMENQRVVA